MCQGRSSIRARARAHGVTGSFHRIREKAGIDRLRFHDLRHSAATLLLARGVPQRVVMEQLGHSTLAMTQRYTHVVPQLMNDAAAAMDRALGSRVSGDAEEAPPLLPVAGQAQVDVAIGAARGLADLLNEPRALARVM